MRLFSRSRLALAAGLVVGLLPISRALADEPPKPSGVNPSSPSSKAPKSRTKVDKTQTKTEQDVPETNLLDAVRDGLVSVEAQGRGDGRMTMTITNLSRRQLRVVLPPGIIAQGATGQFGGMGGGGMGGGGMGGGGMGGGGMGGGMGGGGMGGGGMGGMGGMGRQSGTMPATMGMMMLARMIMYFCGDPESWDQRSLMIGMMGGGGMGGMGGGMMGGMGGGMGGMGGGMRSVPPTSLPFTSLAPGQTRNLPTRLVSLSSPDEEQGLTLPQEGEKLEIVGDITKVNSDPRTQKALKRLASAKAPTSLSQLVMWSVSADLDWKTIAQLSGNWANRHELALAKDFVDHLDDLKDEETGHIFFAVEGSDAATKAIAGEFSQALEGKTLLGLVASTGIPARPVAPSLACQIKLTGDEASVQVTGTDATARKWLPFGKFTQPLVLENGKLDKVKFADSLAEGLLNRLVRAQVIKGSAQKDKGKLVYQIRIENASPLILNGLAFVGTASPEGEMPKVLSGIAISPCRSMLVPTPEESVKSLGLKKGIKVLALDLSGL